MTISPPVAGSTASLRRFDATEYSSSSQSQASRFASMLSTEHLPPTGQAKEPDQVPAAGVSQGRGSLEECAKQMGFGDAFALPSLAAGLESANIPLEVRLVVKAVRGTLVVPGVIARLPDGTITMKKRPDDGQSRARPLLPLIPTPLEQRQFLLALSMKNALLESCWVFVIGLVRRRTH